MREMSLTTPPLIFIGLVRGTSLNAHECLFWVVERWIFVDLSASGFFTLQGNISDVSHRFDKHFDFFQDILFGR